MSAITISESSIRTRSPSTVIETASPWTVTAESSVTTLAARTSPGTTWYSRMSVSVGMSSSRVSTVPSGKAAKASSVGAKTVNGPSPDSVPTRSAAVTAATKVSKQPSATASATMVPGASACSSCMACA